MKPSDKLYELIKSLSKAEKRNFKLLYSSVAHSDSKNFIRLFNLLEKMPFYDEAIIKKQFHGEPMVIQLTATKHYLYTLIIRSLLYLKQNNADTYYESNLKCIPILFNKKLYNHITKLILPIKRKLYETESYQFLLEALHWEEKTNSYLPIFKEAFNKNKQIRIEKESAIKKYQNQCIYNSLKAQTFAIVKDARFLLKKAEFIKIQNEIINTINENPPLSSKAKCDYYYINGTLDFYNGKFKESKLNYKTILQLLKKHPFLMYDPHGISYLGSVQNYMTAVAKVGG